MKNLLANGFRIQKDRIGKMLHLLNKTMAKIQLLLLPTVNDVSLTNSFGFALGAEREREKRKLIFVLCFTVKDVYNYFRAIVSSGEKSLRALHLTDDALKLNASNYTVWQYR